MYVEDADLTQKMRTRGKAYLVPQYTAIHAWHRAAHRSLEAFSVAAAQPAALFFQVGLCVVSRSACDNGGTDDLKCAPRSLCA